MLSYAGVFANGRLLGQALLRYHRTWHPEGGNACFSEAVEIPPELTGRVCGLLEDLRWEGLFELCEPGLKVSIDGRMLTCVTRRGN